MDKDLNPREEAFCLEFAQSLDPKKAAKVAGYRSQIHGYTLLKKPEIQAKIQTLRENRIKRTQITIDMVVCELWQIANADPGDAFDSDGKLKNIKDIPEALRKTIQSVETYEDFTEGVEVGEVQKVKFWDKTKALDMLARHLGMYIDMTINKNLNVNVNEPQTSESFEKVKEFLTTGMGDLQRIRDVKPISLNAKDSDEG